MEGKTATLKEPYKGYTSILLVEKVQYIWVAQIVGSGQLIHIYEDDFILD